MKGVGVSSAVVTELLLSSSSSSSFSSASSSCSSSCSSLCKHQNSICQGQQASAGECDEGSWVKQRRRHRVAAKHLFFFLLFFFLLFFLYFFLLFFFLLFFFLLFLWPRPATIHLILGFLFKTHQPAQLLFPLSAGPQLSWASWHHAYSITTVVTVQVSVVCGAGCSSTLKSSLSGLF